jgi:WD40 repeat protein
MQKTDSVQDLRALISETFNEQLREPEVIKLQLVRAGDVLDDCNTLIESGLEDGCTVDVVKQQRHFIVTGSDDCTAKLWDLESGKCFMTLVGHDGPVSAAKISPDNRLVATSSKDGTVKVWCAADGDCVFTADHDEPVHSTSFSPDGHLLATGTNDGVVFLWDVSTSERVQVLQMPDVAPVRSIDFSSDSASVLIACGDNGATHVWNLANDECVLELKELEEIVLSASFSPDGRTIVTGCSDDMAQVWNSETGSCIHELEGHEGAVYSTSFSPDGRLILTSSSDGTAKLWKAKSGDCVRTLLGHDSDVLSACFSPDGSLIGTSSDDETAKIWSTRTGQCIHTLEGHTAPIHSISISMA